MPISTSSDTAAERWADIREFHPARIMVATHDHDYAYWFGVEEI
jgi:hypothetical protein